MGQFSPNLSNASGMTETVIWMGYMLDYISSNPSISTDQMLAVPMINNITAYLQNAYNQVDTLEYLFLCTHDDNIAVFLTAMGIVDTECLYQ